MLNDMVIGNIVVIVVIQKTVVRHRQIRHQSDEREQQGNEAWTAHGILLYVILPVRQAQR